MTPPLLQLGPVATLLLPLASCSLGPEPGPTPQDPPREVAEPPRPGEPGRDWIHLDSGEWLAGTIDGLRKKDLAFDSDGLDTLRISWNDVVDLRSQRTWSARTVDGDVFVGVLRVDRGKVVITSADGTPHVLPRNRLLRIVPGRERELDLWSGRMSAGFTGREGNTSQTDFTTYAKLTRVSVQGRWNTDFRSTLSEIDGSRTANNQRFQSRWDRFVSDRLFVVPASVDVYRDPFQNVALRVTPSAALGYDVVDSADLDVSISSGPAYLYERRDSVGPGENASEGSFAVNSSARLDWDVTADVDLSLGYDITVSFPGSATFNHHFLAVLGLDLVGDFDLDVSFVWDRIEDPAADLAGQQPERDDFRLTVGLGWQF